MPRAKAWRKSMKDGGYEAMGAHEDYCVAELRGEAEEKVMRMCGEE